MTHAEPGQQTWPPGTAHDLRLWLSGIRGLRSRIAQVRDEIADLEATLRTPPTAHLSHMKIARTTMSDPTFRQAQTAVERLPELRAEAETAERQIRRYEMARSGMPAQFVKLILVRYEEGQTDAQAITELGIPERTYYWGRGRAIEQLWAALL